MRSPSLIIPSFITSSRNALSSGDRGFIVSEDGRVPSEYDKDHFKRPSHAHEGSPPEAISVSYFLFSQYQLLFIELCRTMHEKKSVRSR
mmetsp:Transcript_17672/g.31927  ORF Transcript_17672/g.31927 Transcript_17672/m.31927 type:complete len:89 (-) Transcript_17672:52-318(-)